MKKIITFCLIIFFISNVEKLFSVTPSVPVNLVSTSINYYGAQLNWDAASGASSYTIRYKPDWSLQWYYVKGITGTSYYLQDCQSNCNYQWQICSKNATDSSVYSLLLTFKTLKAIWKENGSYVVATYNFPDVDPLMRQKLLAIQNNSLPTNLELEIRKRLTEELDTIVKKYNNNFGTIYFESEKASYAYAISTLVNGIANDNTSYISKAVTYIEQDDIYTGADKTYKVDLFPSFTIKGQVPKYFFFGRYHSNLTKNYEAKMRKAIWYWSMDSLAFTRSYDSYQHFPTYKPIDPYKRQHPNYTNSGSWDPSGKNSWSDTRNTDNLKAMRETSTYLFMEDVGNDSIKKIYKQRLIDHVSTLFHVGYSEWDSDSYYSHSWAPFCNLYAYAKDTFIRKLAKGALDWYIAAGAAKYYRGTLVGPFKRVYGGDYNIPLLGTAEKIPYVYFGNIPNYPNYATFNERDVYIALLSNYRPPIAMHGLAIQDFDPYTEQLNTHPSYSTFTPLTASAPAFFETMFYGKTYRLGSAVSSFSDGDMCPFGAVIFDSQRGSMPFFVGPKGTSKEIYSVYTAKNSGDQIAQYRNMFIRLQKSTNTYHIAIPLSIPMEIQGNFVFFKYEKTWVAMQLINLQNPIIETITDAACVYKQFIGILKMNVISTSDAYVGMAVQFCDETQLSYIDFKNNVLSNPIDITGLSSGIVKLTGFDGRYLKMQYNTTNDLPFVYRNSENAYDWSNSANFHPYFSITPPHISTDSAIAKPSDILIKCTVSPSLIGPVLEDWKSGTLKVVSNTGVFTASMSTSGEYTWREDSLSDSNGRSKINWFALYDNNSKIFETTDELILKQKLINYTLKNAFAGLHYFKSVAVDAEGDTAWSNVISINYIPTTDIKNESDDLKININPNPANDKIYITIPGNKGELKMYNLQGICCLIQSIHHQQLIDISELKRGVYFVKIQVGTKSEITKLIVTNE